MSFLQVSCIDSSLIQALMIAEMRSCFVVRVCVRMRRFIMAQRVSIGLQSGLLPGQSKTGMLLRRKQSIDFLALWQGAPSCINTKSPSGNQSWREGNKRDVKTWTYWSAFMFPSTMCSRPGPFMEITDHTITFVGCFTVPQVGVGPSHKAQTRGVVDDWHWNVDSSEKQTFAQSSAVQFRYFLAHWSLFTLILWVRAGFGTGLELAIPPSFSLPSVYQKSSWRNWIEFQILVVDSLCHRYW